MTHQTVDFRIYQYYSTSVDQEREVNTNHLRFYYDLKKQVLEDQSYTNFVAWPFWLIPATILEAYSENPENIHSFCTLHCLSNKLNRQSKTYMPSWR